MIRRWIIPKATKGVMQRIFVSFVAAVLALSLVGVPTLAGKPQPFSANVWWTDYQNPVEQQTPGGATQPDRSLWVTNPTPCIWDADDQINIIFGGTLRPGEMYTFTTCLIGDWADHVIGVRNYAHGEPEMVVTVSLDGLATVSNGCIVGPDYDRDYPSFETVTGSNGGVGVRHTVTWTAYNPTSKTIRRETMDGAIRFSGHRDDWCPDPLIRYGSWPGPTWWTSGG